MTVPAVSFSYNRLVNSKMGIKAAKSLVVSQITLGLITATTGRVITLFDHIFKPIIEFPYIEVY